MRFAALPFVVLLVAVTSASAASTGGTPVPGSCRITTPSTSAAAAAAAAAFHRPAFAPTTHSSSTTSSASTLAEEAVTSLRGGAVQEPTTLSDVEGILLKASAEGKLVVIVSNIHKTLSLLLNPVTVTDDLPLSPATIFLTLSSS